MSFFTISVRIEVFPATKLPEIYYCYKGKPILIKFIAYKLSVVTSVDISRKLQSHFHGLANL